MFQKNLVEKYLARLDSALLDRKYAAFRSLFADPARQANIRASKEEQYQEGFVRDLFCSVLGYTIKPEAGYNILTELKNESGSNAKKSDAAIVMGGTVKAVIELKGTDTQDLDRVAFQAFSYKNHHESCPYVIVSNFERLRLYVEVQTEFVEFNLFTLGREEFGRLYLLLALPQVTADVALHLKHETLSEEKEITNSFYADYSAFKRALFEDLCERNLATPRHSEEAIATEESIDVSATPQHDVFRYDKLTLFKKTQKLLDRILFVLFCEDRGLLPPNSVARIIGDWKQLKKLGYPQPLYALSKTFFDRIDTGFVNEDDHSRDVFAYNGGLFRPDTVLDGITVGDDVLLEHSLALADYDFESQISVDILGRIFENSLSEIEEVQAEIRNERHSERSEESPNTDVSRSKSAQHDAEATNIGKRKKDGVFYTPEYITRYIVENTIGELCRRKREELGLTDEAIAEYVAAQKSAQGKKPRRSKK